MKAVNKIVEIFERYMGEAGRGNLIKWITLDMGQRFRQGRRKTRGERASFAVQSIAFRGERKYLIIRCRYLKSIRDDH